MQGTASEYNERIEAVNRERKFHQVRFSIWTSVLPLSSLILESCMYIVFSFSRMYQQNTGVQLNSLTAEWRELCEKNIEIEAVCAEIQNRIEQLRIEAAERYGVPFLIRDQILSQDLYLRFLLET